MKFLVTGHAGFIGNHVALQLLERGDEVVGLDNLNPYYDVNLKQARLDRLLPYDGFTHCQLDLEDTDGVAEMFRAHSPDKVIHLAAQAGVRYSLENPRSYIDSNIVGFLNILEGCRHSEVEHLVYASSSSVYGANENAPFSVHHNVDHPLSLYAASKKSNEMMAHTYSHLFRIPVTGLRFFTVYGPWGRPDMALFLFCKAILEGRPIDVFNRGQMQRDFTFVDDIVEGVIACADNTAQVNTDWSGASPDPGTSGVAPYRVYNIGNSQPVELMKYIEVLEQCLGKTAEKNMLPMQPGDVPATWADVSDLKNDVGYQPSTTVETGVARFVEWYRDFYKV